MDVSRHALVLDTSDSATINMGSEGVLNTTHAHELLPVATKRLSRNTSRKATAGSCWIKIDDQV